MTITTIAVAMSHPIGRAQRGARGSSRRRSASRRKRAKISWTPRRGSRSNGFPQPGGTSGAVGAAGLIAPAPDDGEDHRRIAGDTHGAGHRECLDVTRQAVPVAAAQTSQAFSGTRHRLAAFGAGAEHTAAVKAVDRARPSQPCDHRPHALNGLRTGQRPPADGVQPGVAARRGGGVEQRRVDGLADQLPSRGAPGGVVDQVAAFGQTGQRVITHAFAQQQLSSYGSVSSDPERDKVLTAKLWVEPGHVGREHRPDFEPGRLRGGAEVIDVAQAGERRLTHTCGPQQEGPALACHVACLRREKRIVCGQDQRRRRPGEHAQGVGGRATRRFPRGRITARREQQPTKPDNPCGLVGAVDVEHLDTVHGGPVCLAFGDAIRHGAGRRGIVRHDQPHNRRHPSSRGREDTNVTHPTVMVTGGAGFIGSNLADALLAEGSRVHIVDDLSNGQLPRVPPQAEFHELDIRNAAGLRTIVEAAKPDVIVHLAAQADVRRALEEPSFDAVVNIIGTLSVLEAARMVGARVVFASTGGAGYGEYEGLTVPSPETSETRPLSHYGMSKMSGEGYIHMYGRLYGLEGVCLRLSNVYGPRQDPHGEAGVVAIFCGKMLDAEPPRVFGDGLQTRDYAYVADVCRAFLAAAAGPAGETVNIGTGREVTVLDLIDGLGCTVAPQFEPARTGELQRSCLDPSKAARLYGWRAEMPLTEGLQATLASVASNRANPEARPVGAF